MEDLKLSVVFGPEDGYQSSSVLLARTSSDGSLELLTAAWGRLLGYGRCGLDGKTLREVMMPDGGSDSGPIARISAAILDERSGDSVDLSVRSRDGAIKDLRLHRRPSAPARTIYIVGEEILAAGVPRADLPLHDIEEPR
jgi:PAS domain-containing protein